MTFKFKLTDNIETLDLLWASTRTCPEDLCDLLKQQSRLVNFTPQAIYQPGVVVDLDGNRTSDVYLNVWEYELTDRQQQMLNVAGAEYCDLWKGLDSRTDYINDQMKSTKEEFTLYYRPRSAVL